MKIPPGAVLLCLILAIPGSMVFGLCCGIFMGGLGKVVPQPLFTPVVLLIAWGVAVAIKRFGPKSSA